MQLLLALGVLVGLILVKANEKRALGVGYWSLAAIGAGCLLFGIYNALSGLSDVPHDRILILAIACVFLALLLWIVAASLWGRQRQAQASALLDAAERLQAHRRILKICKAPLVALFVVLPCLAFAVGIFQFAKMASGAAERQTCMNSLKALAGTLSAGKPVGTEFELNPALSDPKALAAATATSNLVPWAWDRKSHPAYHDMSSAPASRHVLFLDGHIDFMEESSFQALKKK